MIRVAVQERQRFLREGLSIVLGEEPDIEVVGAAGTAADLVELCERIRPNVVVLELDCDAWDACRLAAALRRRFRSIRVVGLLHTTRFEGSARAYQAGVRAIVPHSGGSAAVVSAVRNSAGSRPVVTPMATEPDPLPRRVLTAREIEVLEQIGAGLTTREISEQLGIRPKTVENHKQRIFAKLGVQNQAHAVAVALRSGMVAVRPNRSVADG